jgi:glycosyltransferase involved in cell wall biosynthesis
MFYRLYEKINIYTEYQKKLLLKENKNYIHKIEKIKPIVTSFESEHESKKSDKFIILYMGYLSKSKGSNILLSIIKTMIAKYKNIQFKFALNGQKSDKKMIAELMLLKKKYAENIIITGKVNPFDELSKSDLYYYCLERHSDTYAFPFSLYESLQVGTPIIGSDLAGFKEFFDSRLLCSCNKLKVIEFIDKIYQDKNIQKNISKKNLKDLNPRVRKLETL